MAEPSKEHEGEELESEELKREDDDQGDDEKEGDKEGDDEEGDDEEEATWRLMLSEVKDEVQQLKTEVQKKATESQATLEKLTRENQQVQERLAKMAAERSMSQSSPPAKTQPHQEPAPAGGESSVKRSASDESASNERKTENPSEVTKHSPKFKKVLLHRRSI